MVQNPFEIRHTNIDDFQDKVIKLSLNINRIDYNSQLDNSIESKTVIINEKKVRVLNYFLVRSCIRTVRRLTNERYTQTVDITSDKITVNCNNGFVQDQSKQQQEMILVTSTPSIKFANSNNNFDIQVYS